MTDIQMREIVPFVPNKASAERELQWLTAGVFAFSGAALFFVVLDIAGALMLLCTSAVLTALRTVVIAILSK